ncbi:hypothetical protein BHE74_00053502, partial [Ensete ventricosum]
HPTRCLRPGKCLRPYKAVYTTWGATESRTVHNISDGCNGTCIRATLDPVKARSTDNVPRTLFDALLMGCCSKPAIRIKQQKYGPYEWSDQFQQRQFSLKTAFEVDK